MTFSQLNDGNSNLLVPANFQGDKNLSFKILAPILSNHKFFFGSNSLLVSKVCFKRGLCCCGGG